MIELEFEYRSSGSHAGIEGSKNLFRPARGTGFNAALSPGHIGCESTVMGEG